MTLAPDTPGPAAPSSVAGRAVLRATEDLEPVSLDRLNACAELMTRVDRKYLLPPAAVARFVRELDDRLIDDTGQGLAVLEAPGGRAPRYESVYFDTDDLALYRAHLQGRRRRWKVRTRTYVDSGLCVVEVKLKGARGETVKQRVAHPYDRRDVLVPASQAFLRDAVQAAYGVDVPRLRARAVTDYRRTTLVDLAGGARVTCDVDLACRSRAGGRTVPADGHVVVESKSADGRGAADAVLRALGVRPVRVSKYCTAVALLHPQVPVNPWHRTLSQHYGHRRAG